MLGSGRMVFDMGLGLSCLKTAQAGKEGFTKESLNEVGYSQIQKERDSFQH